MSNKQNDELFESLMEQIQGHFDQIYVLALQLREVMPKSEGIDTFVKLLEQLHTNYGGFLHEPN